MQAAGEMCKGSGAARTLMGMYPPGNRHSTAQRSSSTSGIQGTPVWPTDGLRNVCIFIHPSLHHLGMGLFLMVPNMPFICVTKFV